MSSERLDIDQPIEREPGEKVVESIIGWLAFAAFSPMIVVYAGVAVLVDVWRLRQLGNAGPAPKADPDASHDADPAGQVDRYRRRRRTHLMMFGLSLACTASITVGFWLWLR